MSTFLIAAASFVGFLVAYHTYGRWLARRIFDLDPLAEVPSKQLEDGIDYVPSRRSIVFGHHFTSIAGTGPIVGPAIAVFWGWLPALLWVVFGSIFIGAVHDFGALVVSMRNRGQTIGEVAGRMISPRTKILFLLALFFALTVVLAIFGLVIAAIFAKYPESVLAVWISLPIAIVVGIRMRRGSLQLIPMTAVVPDPDLRRSLRRRLSLADRTARRKSRGRLDDHIADLLRGRIGPAGLVIAATARLY